MYSSTPDLLGQLTALSPQ